MDDKIINVGLFKSLWNEFKKFAIQGNAMDLAVGVVIGAAFGGIVTSLVKDIIMPPIGYITGGVDFSDKLVVLKAAVKNPDGSVKVPEVDWRYGAFMNNVVNFLIVATAIFFVIKALSLLHPKPPDTASPPPPATPDQLLLAEIRDLLKEKTRV